MHQDGVAALAKGWAIAGALRLVPEHPGALVVPKSMGHGTRPDQTTRIFDAAGEALEAVIDRGTLKRKTENGKPSF